MASDTMSRLTSVARRQTLTLTHYGRKSNRPYDVIIWFMLNDNQLYLATANRNRNWVKNVRARPRVSMRIGNEVFAGNVVHLDAEADREHVNILVMRKYWWAAPLIMFGRFLARAGAIADTFDAFEVKLDEA